jgi:hypothetical protein
MKRVGYNRQTHRSLVRNANVGTFSCILLILFFAMSAPWAFASVAAPTLGIYDTFNGSPYSGPLIDSSRWYPLEFVREIRDGKLVSRIRAAGPSPVSNSLLFANPSTIQSLQADVRLASCTLPLVGDCGLRLRGSFYSDGTSGTGALGDVRAEVYAINTESGSHVGYMVYRCTNADCSAIANVVAPTMVKAISMGATHVLGMAWNGSLLTFTVDGVPTVVDPKGAQPIGNPTPRVPMKMLTSQVTIFPPGGEGSVAGNFDNVHVNNTLYDDFDGAPFSGPRLDPAKWAASSGAGSGSPPRDVVREIAEGKLVSKVAGTGVTNDDFKSRLRFLNDNAIKAMRADVTVTEYQATSGTSVQARLTGGFYNDGSSTGSSDSTGNVRAGIRIRSLNGGDLYAHFFVSRINDSLGNTETVLCSDSLGSVDLGETHTLFVIWDGSVFTYGITDLGISKTFDPKPYASVVKPQTDHFTEMDTHVFLSSDGASGYIAATFDNVYVNSEALQLPRLAPAFSRAVTGDVVSAGVGLYNTGTGTINLTGIPTGATIEKAFLYWATLGSSGTFTTPTLNGTPVTGTLIGRSEEPIRGALQTFTYRADVTSRVTGNGSYLIAGLPTGPLPPASYTTSDTEGASLVVLYSVPGAPARFIAIHDGAVSLRGNRLQYYATPFTGFKALNPPTGAKLTYIVGDGQSLTPEYAGLNGILLGANEFSGSSGPYWDTRTYNVASAITAGDTSGTATLSTANDALIWVAAILSIPVNVPTVTVTALDPSAGENPANPGSFRLTRSGLLTAPLTVYFGVTGTATANSDYGALPTSVTFAVGQATRDLVVTPVNDALIEAPETVILTLSARAAYLVGSPGSATVTITSEDVAAPNLLGIYTGSGSATNSACTFPPDNGTFPFSATVRITSQVGPNFSGTATFVAEGPLDVTLSGTWNGAGFSGSFTLPGPMTGTIAFTGTLSVNTLSMSFAGTTYEGPNSCHLAGSLTASRPATVAVVGAP